MGGGQEYQHHGGEYGIHMQRAAGPGRQAHRSGTQGTQTLGWNTEGELTSTTEPAVGTKPALGTTYLYDVDGELLIRRASVRAEVAGSGPHGHREAAGVAVVGGA
ncbi:hypothetical protein ACIA74_36425 [Streptomyces sp. NPDC051658]|uniref:hypothetical protein n=1 Tax=Streptomyces sp. NPDC051658 TaxID=3365667 RepID=UPI0037BD23B5